MRCTGRPMLVALLVGMLPACQSLDEMTRPRAVYQAFTTDDTYKEDITAGLSLEVRCIEPEEKESTSPTGKLTKERGPCAFKVVNEAYGERPYGVTPNDGKPESLNSLASHFATCGTTAAGAISNRDCQVARNRVVDLMKRISDENCASFLQQTFLTKSTADSAHRFARDMLTGGTAGAITVSPPTAIGMSFVNLLTGSYESVNGTFFLNEAFQSIETAINLEREDRYKDLERTCSVTATYDSCSIHEAMRQVRRYEDGCSLRAGLNKLQTLVHLQQNEEVDKAAKEESDLLKQDVQDLRDEKAALEKRIAELDVRPVLEDLTGRVAEIQQRMQPVPTPPVDDTAPPDTNDQ